MLAESTATDHDRLVGYDQDAVNGFSPALLDALCAIVAPQAGQALLDAMGGNGTFTARLLDWCAQRGEGPPQLTLLDASHAQLADARRRLPASVRLCAGDVVTMCADDTALPLPPQTYDTIVIKSGLHELPLAAQLRAVASLRRVLRPGGRLISLDVLFDDSAEREAFAALVRWKDRQAGLSQLAMQRHFCTRAEWYGMLVAADFAPITCGRACTYRIASTTLGATYWPPHAATVLARRWEGQVAQAHALRTADRVLWTGTGSVLLIPAEITVAMRPREV